MVTRSMCHVAVVKITVTRNSGSPSLQFTITERITPLNQHQQKNRAKYWFVTNAVLLHCYTFSDDTSTQMIAYHASTSSTWQIGVNYSLYRQVPWTRFTEWLNSRHSWSFQLPHLKWVRWKWRIRKWRTNISRMPEAGRMRTMKMENKIWGKVRT